MTVSLSNSLPSKPVCTQSVQPSGSPVDTQSVTGTNQRPTSTSETNLRPSTSTSGQFPLSTDQPSSQSSNSTLRPLNEPVTKRPASSPPEGEIERKANSSYATQSSQARDSQTQPARIVTAILKRKATPKGNGVGADQPEIPHQVACEGDRHDGRCDVISNEGQLSIGPSEVPAPHGSKEPGRRPTPDSSSVRAQASCEERRAKNGTTSPVAVSEGTRQSIRKGSSLPSRSDEKRSEHSCQTGHSGEEERRVPSEDSSSIQQVDHRVPNVESGVQSSRSSEAETSSSSDRRGESNDPYRLVESSEVRPQRSILGEQHRNAAVHQRPTPGVRLPCTSETEGFSRTLRVIQSCGEDSEEARVPIPGVRGPLFQTGSSAPCNQPDGGVRSPSPSHSSTSETQVHQPNDPIVDHPLHRRPETGCTNSRKRKYNEPLVEFVASNHYSTAAEMQSLPLHARFVKPLDVDAIRSLASPEDRHRFDTHHAVNSDPAMFSSIYTSKEDEIENKIPQADESLLRKVEVIIPAEKKVIKHFIKLLFSTEVAKGRRRLLAWPQRLNDEYRTSYPTVSKIRDTLIARDQLNGRKDLWAVCFDIAISFNQFRKSAEVAPYYGLNINGRYYTLNVMGMGEVHAADCMHTATTILAKATVTKWNVEFHVHVDNVRFLGSKEQVTGAAKYFKQLCEQCSITLNVEDVNEPHQCGDFLGMNLDYRNGTVKLSAKMIKKLSSYGDYTKLSFSQFRSYFGVVYAASRILRIPWCMYYHYIKFIRRRLSEYHRQLIKDDDPINIWPSIIGHVRGLHSLCLMNSAVTTPVTTEREYAVVVAVDASTTGWGIIAFDEPNNECYSIGGKWPRVIEAKDINVFEAKTLAMAANLLRKVIQHRKVLFLVDNTSVKYTSKKGRSTHFELNEHIASLLSTLDTYDTEAYVAYVSTNVNPADANSRGNFTTPTSQLSSSLWALRGEVEEVRTATPKFYSFQPTVSTCKPSFAVCQSFLPSIEEKV